MFSVVLDAKMQHSLSSTLAKSTVHCHKRQDCLQWFGLDYTYMYDSQIMLLIGLSCMMYNV